jgi:predicted RNA-binding Zn ribbon-like protein
MVQELVNTASAGPAHGLADLLATPTGAQAWLDDALAIWSARTGGPAPPLTLAETDLPPLRRLREQVRELLAADPRSGGALPARRVQLHVGDGVAGYRTTGTGWRAVAGMVLAETLLAQHDGTWSRLKVCANPACRVAFYDRSRNASRVWHDTQACGNPINLRASRARRSGRFPAASAGNG